MKKIIIVLVSLLAVSSVYAFTEADMRACRSNPLHKTTPECEMYDLNGDGYVTPADELQWRANQAVHTSSPKVESSNRTGTTLLGRCLRGLKETRCIPLLQTRLTQLRAELAKLM